VSWTIVSFLQPFPSIVVIRVRNCQVSNQVGSLINEKCFQVIELLGVGQMLFVMNCAFIHVLKGWPLCIVVIELFDFKFRQFANVTSPPTSSGGFGVL